MSENRKSVFFSKKSLEVIRLFSSGRLNSIIERYESLIDTKKIDSIFLVEEMEYLYHISKESATKERSPWQNLKVKEVISKINKTTLDFNKKNIISKLEKLDKFEEISLIEKIENYWLDERIRLFNEYRNSKNKN